MADKQLYATGTFKYNNRMMTTGEPVTMSGPHRRLYLALGKVTEEKPKAVKAETVEVAQKPVRKPRKRAARK